MAEPDTSSRYLSRIIERLEQSGFDCSRDVNYSNQVWACAARRTRFELTKFGFSETFYLFAEFPSIDFTGLQEYSAVSFNYALKHKSILLPRGLFESVSCFPVAVADSVDAGTAEAVRNNTPRKHWSSAEFPVIYELNSRTLHCSEKTPIWGAAYYAGFRQQIRQMLAP